MAQDFTRYAVEATNSALRYLQQIQMMQSLESESPTK